MNEGAFEYFIVISACAVKRNSRILACSPAILDHVANQIIPHCKSHASVLMLMPWTSKTLKTDRGPPTFGDGIFPKQVISSVAHLDLFGIFHLWLSIAVFGSWILTILDSKCINWAVRDPEPVSGASRQVGEEAIAWILAVAWHRNRKTTGVFQETMAERIPVAC